AEGPVRRGRVSLLCRIEPAPAGGSLGAGRAACGGAGSPARRDHGQNPHGRVRVWRHRAEQPPRGTVQPVGCRGASLGRRLVERRRVSLLEGSASLAFGSDTAGSVRIPASMTGNAGLKVTIGRWSTG